MPLFKSHSVDGAVRHLTRSLDRLKAVADHHRNEGFAHDERAAEAAKMASAAHAEANRALRIHENLSKLIA